MSEANHRPEATASESHGLRLGLRRPILETSMGMKPLRIDFDAPNAKFVCATLGQTAKGAEGNEGLILNARLAVDGKTGKYPEFKGNVATVYTNPVSMGGASNGHYGGNAETYMNVGEAMGKGMVELMKNE